VHHQPLSHPVQSLTHCQHDSSDAKPTPPHRASASLRDEFHHRPPPSQKPYRHLATAADCESNRIQAKSNSCSPPPQPSPSSSSLHHGNIPPDQPTRNQLSAAVLQYACTTQAHHAISHTIYESSASPHPQAAAQCCAKFQGPRQHQAAST
jgi:hypothetical protein